MRRSDLPSCTSHPHFGFSLAMLKSGSAFGECAAIAATGLAATETELMLKRYVESAAAKSIRAA